MNLKNRIGHKYGRLVVLSRAENDKWGNAKWLCRCDCGNEKVVNGPELNCGDTQSCGCLRSDVKKTDKNPMWKGGRIKTAGYIQIKLPEHHHANNQGYVFEHILVIEKMLGRPINRGEIVHHCNQDRSDNRPYNLRLFPSIKEHTAYHHKINSMGKR